MFRKSLASTVTVKPQGLVLTGQYTVAQVEERLEKYIEEHVLCKICGNPETKVVHGKKNCLACGSNST